jgi:GNAT superfamily N-acetyltransferase
MTADEAIAVQRDVTEVYRSAFGAPPYNEGEAQVQQFRDDMLPRHTQRDGFRFVVALESDRVVGFAYGYTGERGQWWTDTVAKAMPADVAEKWLGGHFEFVEIAVLPEFQGRGIGTALHDALLEVLPHSKAVLSTLQADTPAMRLYLRKGWQVLLDNFHFPGSNRSSLILGLSIRG